MTDTADTNRRSNVRSIEGGRAIKARDVQAEFAKETSSVSELCPNAAGFFVIMWDDEGEFAYSVHKGDRNPYAPSLLPNIVKEKVRAALVEE